VPQLPDDSLRAVLDTVFAAPAYAWDDETHPLATVQTWWQRLGEWLAATRTAHPELFKALIVGLCLVLAAILAHAGWVLLRTLRAASRLENDAPATPSAGFRRDAGWYFRAADEAAAAGRYREALSLAFEALILRLDGLGALRWGPGKTARDYAREARLSAGDRERLGGLVGALYRCVYGGAACGPDEYRAVRGLAAGAWDASPG